MQLVEWSVTDVTPGLAYGIFPGQSHRDLVDKNGAPIFLGLVPFWTTGWSWSVFCVFAEIGAPCFNLFVFFLDVFGTMPKPPKGSVFGHEEHGKSSADPSWAQASHLGVSLGWSTWAPRDFSENVDGCLMANIFFIEPLVSDFETDLQFSSWLLHARTRHMSWLEAYKPFCRCSYHLFDHQTSWDQAWTISFTWIYCDLGNLRILIQPIPSLRFGLAARHWRSMWQHIQSWWRSEGFSSGLTSDLAQIDWLRIPPTPWIKKKKHVYGWLAFLLLWCYDTLWLFFVTCDIVLWFVPFLPILDMIFAYICRFAASNMLTWIHPTGLVHGNTSPFFQPFPPVQRCSRVGNRHGYPCVS